MQVFYRISDKSYPKVKLPGATKEMCLSNFLNCFDCEIHLVADNCSDATVDMCQRLLEGRQHLIFRNSNGNAGSLRWCLEMATKLTIEPNEVLYFVEDDYLHTWISARHNSPAISPQEELENVLKRGDTDYATLFDHPDKYQDVYEGGEDTKVFRTTNSHWRFSTSTTMTFATTKQVLLKDLDIWNAYADGDHPRDHSCFLALRDTKRQLVVRIPGLALHVDLAHVRSTSCLMEKWAIELMEDHFLEEILPSEYLESDLDDLWSYLPPEMSLRRLMMMSAMPGQWKAPSHQSKENEYDYHRSIMSLPLRSKQ